MKLAITTLATSVAALLTLGLVMLYSASMTQKGAHLLLTQIIWCAKGCAACVTATSCSQMRRVTAHLRRYLAT